MVQKNTSLDSHLSRRDFLKAGVKGSAGLAAFSGITFLTRSERVFGANDRLRVAVAGVRSQGFVHVQSFAKQPKTEVVALCDVDENVLRLRLADMEKLGLPKPQTYVDYRQLLEDKSIDAVSIATPNHWHSLMGIWACQAGKDVYVEKPCSHNLWEGRQLVRAAGKYNRVVMHGTQGRTAGGYLAGIKKMREGLIGELYMARGLCFKWRDTIGRAPVEPVPPGVHYDLWTGPARLKPFTRNRFHYNWHWVWDTGNGDIGNQGVHEIDLARWGLGVGLPRKISAIGGHFMFDDDQETPNTSNCAFEFDLPGGQRRMLVFEVRHWITNTEVGIGTPGFGEGAGALAPAPGVVNKPSKFVVGDVFYGSRGYVAMSGTDTYRSWLGENQEPGPTATGGENRWAHFLDCVRNHQPENVKAPIEEGHLSCALIHLANASYRLGRTLHFDPEREEVIGDDEANRMLRGSYREPYVVPEKV